MKLLTSKYSEPSVSIALLLLRVVAGSTMLSHGLQKISGFNKLLERGFIDPFYLGQKVSLCLTIFAEVFCAALVVLGLLTRLASLPIIITMVVALFIVHNGLLYSEGESAGIFLTVFVVLFLMGPGRYSLDKKLGK